MNIAKFQNLMKDNFSCKSWHDQVPENAKFPAIAYSHNSHSAAKLLNGSKSGRSDNWTVTIATKKDEDVEKLVKEAEMLHNLMTEDYQRVFVTVNTIGAQLKDEKHRTTTLTIQTFEV